VHRQAFGEGAGVRLIKKEKELDGIALTPFVPLKEECLAR